MRLRRCAPLRLGGGDSEEEAVADVIKDYDRGGRLGEEAAAVEWRPIHDIEGATCFRWYGDQDGCEWDGVAAPGAMRGAFRGRPGELGGPLRRLFVARGSANALTEAEADECGRTQSWSAAGNRAQTESRMRLDCVGACLVGGAELVANVCCATDGLAHKRAGR